MRVGTNYNMFIRNKKVRLKCFVSALHDEGEFYSHNDEEYPFDWSKREFC